MRKLDVGTPKTLEQAIANGLNDIYGRMRQDGLSRVEVIQIHVRDFMAQKFANATMQADDQKQTDDLLKLFDVIIKKAA